MTQVTARRTAGRELAHMTHRAAPLHHRLRSLSLTLVVTAVGAIATGCERGESPLEPEPRLCFARDLGPRPPGSDSAVHLPIMTRPKWRGGPCRDPQSQVPSVDSVIRRP